MLPATSKYIGVTTIGGHVARAIDFQARGDVYVVLGKASPWEIPSDPTIGDGNPPVPSPLTMALEEPLVAKKATLQLVVPDAAGTVQVYGQRWRLVTPQEAIEIGGHWVLAQADFNYNEVPVTAADSFLAEDVLAGAGVLPMDDARGYTVGDRILLGLDGAERTVTGADPMTGLVTLDAPLVDPLIKGTFISNLDAADPFAYRQISVVSHAGSTGAAGQTVLPYEMLTTPLLEYYHNSKPIPRELNRKDSLLLVLTF